ncbi:hypothetical protein B6U99_07335 [Candidatus Geothermarchaeota archaeon ex4572_27]|nr:MAG: hypothetical protein B6U99_07335 [Candidatus Geothermarchaeota archaeon ex4572_27]
MDAVSCEKPFKGEVVIEHMSDEGHLRV